MIVRSIDRRIARYNVFIHTQTHICIPSAGVYFHSLGSNRGLGYAVVVVIIAVVIVAVIGNGSSSSSSSNSSSGSTWFFSVWLAEVRLTVPPLYDKHALVISIIEVECVLVTITVRGGPTRGPAPRSQWRGWFV